MNDMTYRPLGASGLNVSVMGLGCSDFGFRMDQEGANTVTAAALDAGVNLFDTAPSYRNAEEFLGKALKAHRHEVVIATKYPSEDKLTRHNVGSRHHIISACEASLRRLGTDYIDLYQAHLPDTGTPIDETLSALDDLVRSGKVRYLGGSNFTAWQIADADWTSRTRGWSRMISAQHDYSLVNREVDLEVAPACARFGLGLLPYFPLASGVLTGKYRRNRQAPSGSRLAKDSVLSGLGTVFLQEKVFDVVEALERVASDAGVSLVDIALGGLAVQPAVSSVIAGATSPEQVRSNARGCAWLPPRRCAGRHQRGGPGALVAYGGPDRRDHRTAWLSPPRTRRIHYDHQIPVRQRGVAGRGRRGDRGRAQ